MGNNAKPRHSRLLAAACILLLALAMAGCQSLKKSGRLFAGVGDRSPLRVGIVADSPPLAYKKGNTLTGLEATFADGLAAFANRPLELVELERTELALALMERKIDIAMAGLTVMAAQQQKLATCSPYLISGQIALVHLDDYKRLGQGPVNLTAPDVRLGVVAATSGDTLTRELKPRGKVFRFANPDEGVQALIKNTIDVFISDLPANFRYAALYIDKGLTPGATPLTQEPLTWAVHPENDALRQQANAYLAALEKNNQLEPLLEKYLPFYHHSAYGLKKP